MKVTHSHHAIQKTSAVTGKASTPTTVVPSIVGRPSPSGIEATVRSPPNPALPIHADGERLTVTWIEFKATPAWSCAPLRCYPRVDRLGAGVCDLKRSGVVAPVDVV